MEKGAIDSPVEAAGFTFAPALMDGEIGFHGFRFCVDANEWYFYDKQE